jgi:hypothetical protein
MPRVGLLETGSRWIRELRKWNLAPLGAVLVVVLLSAGVITMLATGGEQRDESLVRKYFASAAGGGAPAEQARRIEVNDCRRLDRIVRNEFVYECSIVFAGRDYSGCFALSDNRVVLGSRQLASLVPDCDRLFWDKTSQTLVVR